MRINNQKRNFYDDVSKYNIYVRQITFFNFKHFEIDSSLIIENFNKWKKFNIFILYKNISHQ